MTLSCHDPLVASWDSKVFIRCAGSSRSPRYFSLTVLQVLCIFGPTALSMNYIVKKKAYSNAVLKTTNIRIRKTIDMKQWKRQLEMGTRTSKWKHKKINKRPDSKTK